MVEPVSAFELVDALLGAVFLAIGSVALGLSAMTRRTGEPTLFWFAIFAAMYGVRQTGSTPVVQTVSGLPDGIWSYWVSSLSYLILVPAGFLTAAVLGTGWRGTLRLYPRLAAGVAIVSIVFDLLTRDPGAAMPINRLLVALGFVLFAVHLVPRWRTAWESGTGAVLSAAAIFAVVALYETFAPASILPGFHLEPIALAAVIVAIGHYTAARVLASEARLAAVASELATARRIQESILPQGTPALHGLHIEARYVPMTEVAGDFYEFVRLDDSRVAILVADVSGHGVPAALIASMVKIAVASHAGHAAEPADMLEALSRTFQGRIEGSFITATYAVIDSSNGTVTYSSAGHPPALLMRRGGNIERLQAGAIMLGVVASEYPKDTSPFDVGDRLLLYTDGLTEAAPDAIGEFFGDVELDRTVRDGAQLSLSRSADLLLARVRQWARPKGGSLDDDLTFVMIERSV